MARGAPGDFVRVEAYNFATKKTTSLMRGRAPKPRAQITEHNLAGQVQRLDTGHKLSTRSQH